MVQSQIIVLPVKDMTATALRLARTIDQVTVRTRTLQLLETHRETLDRARVLAQEAVAVLPLEKQEATLNDLNIKLLRLETLFTRLSVHILSDDLNPKQGQ
ncbi:hypothetical protein [Asticcacaulis sp. YBE204]|uniref:hypothetical protein n=1 Tax=Asticcacaulis sp. YBE204 TaxID=1282363 RepID=UPI0003C4047B|nr:hypothetical protein [Asticcacaulis sp. YBE204]ESQ79221.1 hypothetical protein AEYBE204_09435 [Asticcacaulis sp. YBE204]